MRLFYGHMPPSGHGGSVWLPGLGTHPKDAPDTLRKRLNSLAAAQEQLDQLRASELRDKATWLAAQARQVKGGTLVAEKVTGTGPGELRQLAAEATSRIHPGPAIVVLGLEHAGKALLTVAISASLAGASIQAAQVITRAAKAVGGGGGGTGPIASAGGRHPENLDQALSLAEEDAAQLLGGR
jgi:alanyl-tRNA synthetase